MALDDGAALKKGRCGVNLVALCGEGNVPPQELATATTQSARGFAALFRPVRLDFARMFLLIRTQSRGSSMRFL